MGAAHTPGPRVRLPGPLGYEFQGHHVQLTAGPVTRPILVWGITGSATWCSVFRMFIDMRTNPF